MMMKKFLRLGRRQVHTIISRETIKPSSPTPSKLHTYNLSPIDHLADKSYIPLVLFYPNNGNCNLSPHVKAKAMKKSLSQSLTQYYPFAGRLHTPTTPYVDCNDDGVIFVEAKNDSQMEIFQHISELDETLDQLFVDDLIYQKSPGSTSIAGVQLNHFACGGVAVGVSMSHIIGDGCSLGSFLNHWASVARYGSVDHKEVLPLNPQIIHSERSNSIQPEAQIVSEGYTNRVTRKFVFPNTKLCELKNKVITMAAAESTSPINKPTRIDVLTSLLYKTAVAAANKKTGCFKPSYLFMLVNIRNKLVQNLPETTMGNIVSVMMVPTRHITEISLSGVVAEIQKEKSQYEGIQSLKHAAENIKTLKLKMGNEDVEDVTQRSYWCSSLCRSSYNKADFGWGKPMGATMPLSPDKIGFLLKDTPDGDGIEVVVVLDREDMEIFKNDKEMLSFAK